MDLQGRLVTGYNALDAGAAPLDVPDGRNNTVVGHGTMIAGLVVRVSPNSMIMPIRVINGDGFGSMMKVIKGIHYAVRHGASVINMSFETDTYSLALADALDEAYGAGIVLVASAGNDSTSAPRYPAALSNVIGVASVESNDTLSAFSNFGVNASLVAPGSSIRSTFWNGGFATWSGTSFAAPFAAAEAAEILARDQNLSPGQVTYTMLATANSVDYLNPGYVNMLGAGIIDFQAAINSE
jgi:subtilisin family serine protease